MKKIIYTLIALTLVVTISKAQMIPNAGFENWTSMGGGAYNNPSGWGNMNNGTSIASVYTCEKGMPGAVGSFYLKLTSKNTVAGVAPGIAVSGVLDSITMMPKSGFAYTSRPTALAGKWQHMIGSGGSQGYIDVKLTRWDTGTHMRVPVGTGHVALSGMAMSWANFSVPVTYTDSNNPDTCIIMLSASGLTGAANGDYLWVDGLAFTGITGITENYFDANISIFPNPTSSYLTVDLSALKDQKVCLQIVDMQGKQIRRNEEVSVASKTMLDIADLSKGNYMLNIITKEGTVTRKFIKQ